MRREGARPASKRAGLRLLFTLGGVLLLALIVTGGGDVSAAPSVRSSTPFTFNFTGDPTTPIPWTPSNWDVVVHSRDLKTFDRLEGMQAQHGANCGAYPATHYNDSYEGAVFLCHNHVMTAINAHGYGEIVLTPDHMVDFAGGETTISFNLSTLRTALRDWVDIWITPFNDNLVLPLDELVDLQGPPPHAIHVRMDQTTGTVFRAELIDNFVVTKLPFNGKKTLEKLLASPSAVTRTKFALTISPTHLTFGAPALGFNWVDTPITQLAWSRGIVQLSHHSYNPTKKCVVSATMTCVPNTWHWSDFSISNAVPFTLIRGDHQAIHGAPTLVTFPSAAPHSSFLRFAAIGTIDVSFDGGKTWQPAKVQSQQRHNPEHFSSYWIAVPAGTTSVNIRGTNWFAGPWWVRDVSIWSASVGGSTTKAPPAPVQALPRTSTAPLKPAEPLSLLAAWRGPVPIAGGIVALVVIAGAAYLLVRRRRIPPGPR
jgi:hypothetical protein